MDCITYVISCWYKYKNCSFENFKYMQNEIDIYTNTIFVIVYILIASQKIYTIKDINYKLSLQDIYLCLHNK